MKVKSISSASKIGIFSPSEPITQDREDRFKRGLNVLRSNGYQCVLGKNVYLSHYYMAGTISQRVGDIHELCENNEVDALIASWGGKSCNQILSEIDYEIVFNSRKPIMAFSDGCVLLNAITEVTGLNTFHGPNVAGKMFETRHSNLKLLHVDTDYNSVNILGNIKKSEYKVIKSGTTQGRLFGGNLSTFVLGLVGSKYMPRFNNGVFFWESMGQKPQIVHQYLTCLRNAGLFDRLGGMVIGDFITEENEDYKVRRPFEMIEDVTDGFNFPILYSRTFGHPRELENPIIPIGATAELSTDSISLTLCEGVVF